MIIKNKSDIIKKDIQEIISQREREREKKTYRLPLPVIVIFCFYEDNFHEEMNAKFENLCDIFEQTNTP